MKKAIIITTFLGILCLFIWAWAQPNMYYGHIDVVPKTEALAVEPIEKFEGKVNTDIRFVSIPHPKFRYVRIDIKLQTIQLNYNNKVINYETEEELNNWLYDNFNHQSEFINR